MKCKVCEIDKQICMFRENTDKRRLPHRKYRSKTCLDCEKQRNKAYKSSAAGRASTRRTSLKNKYGLTEERLNKLYREQNGKCFICLEDYDVEKLCVDHDHDCCAGGYTCGQCVRGLLCRTCNSGLGKFRDSVCNLQRGILLIQQYKLKRGL